MLDHEKLDVYNRSIDFLAIAVKLTIHLPKGYSTLADQLKRASMSIPLNIAEGCGKSTKPDKKRFYTIARGSALECAAIMDVMKVLGIGDGKDLSEGKELLTRIVAMLTRMGQSSH